MRRRDFIKVVAGSAMTWPLFARAQQPHMPVIFHRVYQRPHDLADRLRGFRQGLRDSGFVEGQNVAIEYRWAENKLDRLPDLAGRRLNCGAVEALRLAGFLEQDGTRCMMLPV